jgi:hypothetical protein
MDNHHYRLLSLMSLKASPTPKVNKHIAIINNVPDTEGCRLKVSMIPRAGGLAQLFQTAIPRTEDQLVCASVAIQSIINLTHSSSVL